MQRWSLVVTFMVLLLFQGCKLLEKVDENTTAESVDLSGLKQRPLLSADERYLFVNVGSKGVDIFDLSSLQSPRLVRTWDVEDVTYDLALQGERLVLANGSEGVEIVDVSKPENPQRSAWIRTGDENATTVALSSDTVAIGTAEGVQLYDLSQLQLPRYLARYESNGTIRGIAFDSVRARLWLANAGYGAELLDISDMSSPDFQDAIAVEGSAWDMRVNGETGDCYVVSLTSALRRLDLDAQKRVELATYYDPHDGGRSFGIVNGERFRYLYLAKGERGLEIVDNSDPAHPRHLSYFDTNGTARGVAVNRSETVAFVADGQEGLKIIDISDKAHPRRIGYVKF